MTAYNTIALHVLAPAMDLIRGTHTMSCLRELEESQRWPLERIEELQSARLRRLITHAYEHVPYYRRVMDERRLTPSDIRSAADLAKLPVLTKAAIVGAADSILSDDFRRAKLRPMSTSGSTGEPLSFYSTAEDQFSHGMARTFRALQWAGVLIGDRYATLARARHYDRRREQVLHQIITRVRRAVELDYCWLSDECLSRLVQQLRQGRFISLAGVPPLLCLLAEYIRDRKVEVPHITSIVSMNEQLYPHERCLLRETFGCEPYSNYSAFEAYDIASECDAHEGLHVQSEDIVVEVTDEAGTTVPAGHSGRILLTNLHNCAMPFIRYEIGDSGTLSWTPCRCGRQLPRLVGVVGRVSELIVTRSGRRVFAADLGLESFGLLGVRQFRIVQHELDRVVAYIVWHSNVDSDTWADREQRIIETLCRRIGQGVTITVEAVDSIEPTPAGKHMVVVSKCLSRLPHPAQG